MKALIIDLTGDNEVRILNTRITSAVTILAGYYMSLSPDDDAIEMTAAKLKQEGLLEIPAYIIPRRDFMQSHVFLFPPMPDKEIKKILPREIADAADTGEKMVFNYIKNGTVREKQVEKLEVAAFFAAQKNAFDFLNRLKAKGINPVKIIPEVQGLKTLVETNKTLSGERSGTVFLELMGSRINLNIFKSSHWSLEREFAFHFEVSDELTEEDLSRISIELNRTFQYFKQRNRSYDVNRVILHGTNPNLKHLTTFIMDNHPVEAEIIEPDHFKTKIAYPPHMKDREEFLNIFAVSVSIAVSMTRKKVLNLFPEEYTEKEKMPRRLVGLTISAAIIGAILVGSTFWLERVKASYRKDINDLQKTYLSLSKNAAAIDQTRRRRAAYFRRRFFTEFPVRYAYGAADFVRRLSLIVTAKVELVGLEIKPNGQDFTFTLTGSIAAADNISAQADFLRFYQELKAFYDMVDITFSTIKVNAGDSPEAKSRRAAGARTTRMNEKDEVELFFTVNGEIELE